MKKTLICLLSVLLTLCLFVSCMFDTGLRSEYKRIEVTKQPKKTVFIFDDSNASFSQQFDFTGLEVKGFKSDSDTEGVDITKDCYIYSPKLSSGAPVTNSLEGTHELTVLYTQGGETLTTTFEIKVVDGNDYMMLGSTWYTKISVDQSGWTSITFTKTKPESITTEGVDLTKNATGLIKGYLCESGTDKDIYIVGDCFIGNTDCSYMFSGFSGLKKITGLEYFDTSLVTTMNNMFQGSSILESLDLSSFNTSLVTNMGSMFNSCSNLESLDLSNFNTSKVVDMKNMFNNCDKITSLNLSSFDTSKVTNMHEMFYNCLSLKSIDLSSFDISKSGSRNNLNTDYIFSLSGLTTVYVSSDMKTTWEGLNTGKSGITYSVQD